jgi:hypothetical protein
VGLHITFFDITNVQTQAKPKLHKGTTTIAILIGLEAKRTIPCSKTLANAINWGFDVVAVLPELNDKIEQGGKAIIVYSLTKHFKIGYSLGDLWIDLLPAGYESVNIITINGQDFRRNDKNMVVSNKISPCIPFDAVAGWYDTLGQFCGTDIYPDGMEPVFLKTNGIRKRPRAANSLSGRAP